ncbi:MAG: hypothetical protein GF355_16940, partial [Candidatus Eisenbacteria bacterium]|nr:hypothetical protein [Candidatus Eisenbacteria bacterium]
MDCVALKLGGSPMDRTLCRLLLAAAVLFVSIGFAAGQRGVVIEDFESGGVELESYPDQDHQPNQWEVTEENTFGGSAYALHLYGNTWKMQSIAPYAVADSTVWQVAAWTEGPGEMQAFGVGDGQNELLYTFAGIHLPQGEKWWTVYQGAFPLEEWYAYLLPIGADWYATFGYYPELTYLIYVNDDDGRVRGTTVFDEIIDVTEDLPVPPAVEVEYTVERSTKISETLYRVGVQFHGLVFDPDSDAHEFHWDFGDSSFSAEQDPLHEFLIESDDTYTVGLIVRDPDSLAGYDTCQVAVEPGDGEWPVTVNFVGDIMTARTYEYNGGIIDTYGIEYLYESTLSIFGEAADVNVCNLECPFTNRGEPHPTKSVVFRAKPENIAGVAYAGIDLVTLGNNHII